MMCVFIEYCLYDAHKLVLSGKFLSAMDLLPKEGKQTQKLKGEFSKCTKGSHTNINTERDREGRRHPILQSVFQRKL